MHRPLHFLKYNDNDRITTFSFRFSVLKFFLNLLKIYFKFDLRKKNVTRKNLAEVTFKKGILLKC